MPQSRPPSYLSLHARINGLAIEDVDRALYDDRSLVKQLAMRRTLFVFPRDLLPAAWGSASARIAPTLGTRLAKELEAAGFTQDGRAWLAAAKAAVSIRVGRWVGACGCGAARTGARVGWSDRGGAGKGLRRKLPDLSASARPTGGRGRHRARPQRRSLAGVPTEVHADARWLGEEPEPIRSEAGYAELVRRWLRTFGPGTAADIQWWLGATVGIVKSALAAVEAVTVSLGSGAVGYVLPDDLDPEPMSEPWAALLPVLDPTVMGWKDRRFFLGELAGQLFDSNGNAGTTAWWDGRIVGCWVQDPAGEVRVVLLENVGSAAIDALNVEANRLTEWLAGVRVSTVYPSPAMKAATKSAGANPTS